MRYIVVFGLLMLSGCQSIVANTPTIEYCDDVELTYDRKGNKAKFNISGECQLPIGGGSMLPNPLTLIPK